MKYCQEKYQENYHGDGDTNDYSSDLGLRWLSHGYWQGRKIVSSMRTSREAGKARKVYVDRDIEIIGTINDKGVQRKADKVLLTFPGVAEIQDICLRFHEK